MKEFFIGVLLIIIFVNKGSGQCQPSFSFLESYQFLFHGIHPSENNRVNQLQEYEFFYLRAEVVGKPDHGLRIRALEVYEGPLIEDTLVVWFCKNESGAPACEELVDWAEYEVADTLFLLLERAAVSGNTDETCMNCKSDILKKGHCDGKSEEACLQRLEDSCGQVCGSPIQTLETERDLSLPTCAFAIVRQRQGIASGRIFDPEEDTTLTVFEFTALIDNLGPLSASGSPLKNSEFKIFPNPACEIIYIQRHGTILNHTVVRLRDILGRIIRQKEHNLHQTCSLSLSGLPSGVYWIEIETAGVVETFRMMKK